VTLFESIAVFLVYCLMGTAWVAANPEIEEATKALESPGHGVKYVIPIVFTIIWPYFLLVQIFELISKFSD
jgi:hypothetical protein